MNISISLKKLMISILIFAICLSAFSLSACSLSSSDSNSHNTGTHTPDDSSSYTSATSDASVTSGSSVLSSSTGSSCSSASLAATSSAITTVHPDTDFVEITSYIPDAIIDLKYATNANFTNSVIYSFKTAYLRYGTIIKLSHAAEILRTHGYRIKIWDAFRPFEAQVALWNAYPDGNFVANPAKGYTSHNLGNTIDLTITYMDGTEADMPTTFDDFSAKADRNYSDVTSTQASTSAFLESIMTECGFKGYINEWWHYEDTDTYPPDTSFLPPK